MTTAWAHLPNAKLIDQVLDDLVKCPKEFNASWNRAQDAIRPVTYDAVFSYAQNAVRNTIWDAAQVAIRDMFHIAAFGKDLYAAQNVAWNAIMALIAYDDCGFWLSPGFSLTAMKVSQRLDGHPSTFLLQPYKLFLENK